MTKKQKKNGRGINLWMTAEEYEKVVQIADEESERTGYTIKPTVAAREMLRDKIREYFAPAPVEFEYDGMNLRLKNGRREESPKG